MPLYEFKCECGEDKEILLSFQHPEQVCKCGKVMRLKVSAYSFAFKSTGNQMALDTLNDGHNGMPNKWWKPDAEKAAFAGTQKREKTIW